MKIIKDKLLGYIRKNILLILLVAISLPYAIPLAQPGFINGHDNIPQVARIAARIKALSEGQFPVRWAGDLNYGYGHPGYIFFYSLSGYIASFLYFLGISLENGYKILLAGTFTFTGISFYLWIKQFLKKEFAFISSLFYMLAPYNFLDTFVRAHLGESLFLAIIPLVFLFVEKNLKKPSINLTILGGIFFALTIHSHSILSFIFVFVITAYVLLKGYRNKKALFYNFAILGMGLLLSAYYWAPALIEGKYINSKIFLSDWYTGHFLSLSNIIYSNWGFGSNVNDVGGLSAQIGPLHVLLTILSLYIILKKKTYWNVVLFWFAVFVFGAFMSISVSDFLWSRIYLLQQFQFPWRFIALTAFCSSVLAGYTLQALNSKKLYVISAIVLIILSIPMTKILRIESKSDAYYFNYAGTAAYHNEATTIWVKGDAYEYPKKRLEIISGQGAILDYRRKIILHTFTLISQTDVKILDNTVYFPGWRAIVDGKKVPIEFQDMNHRGLIIFDVPKGKHNVKVIFGESPIRMLSDIASLFSLIGVLLILIFKKSIKFIK